MAVKAFVERRREFYKARYGYHLQTTWDEYLDAEKGTKQENGKYQVYKQWKTYLEEVAPGLHPEFEQQV